VGMGIIIKIETCVQIGPNLSMKEWQFVLFCIVIMRSTKLGCFRSSSWCLWKALEEGCMGLVP